MKKALKILTFVVASAMTVTMVSCSDDEPKNEPTLSETYAGTYNGTMTLNVAGQYSYDADMSVMIVAADPGTITVSIPDYTLTGTMMGDIELGEITIAGLVYNEDKGGFYRDCGGEGLTQSMNGVSYPLNAPSSILVVRDNDGNLTVDFPFTLGKMPLPLTATFKSK